MMKFVFNLDPSWVKLLSVELESAYFDKLLSNVNEAYEESIVYPSPDKVFDAFNATPPQKVKVVVLGQDPYHGPDQAHGLSFSVQKDQRIPPSLRNIYKELTRDLGIPNPSHGNLTSWTKQGVLLLNSTLTVEKQKPNSHSKLGWTTFTNSVLFHLSRRQQGIVYMLWGKQAQEKKPLIEASKNLILEAPHPSPFSAHRGFFGCNHFSRANTFLASIQKPLIDWAIPD